MIGNHDGLVQAYVGISLFLITCCAWSLSYTQYPAHMHPAVCHMDCEGGNSFQKNSHLAFPQDGKLLATPWRLCLAGFGGWVVTASLLFLSSDDHHLFPRSNCNYENQVLEAVCSRQICSGELVYGGSIPPL